VRVRGSHRDINSVTLCDVGRPWLIPAPRSPDREDVDDLTKEFLIESSEGLDCMERCLNDLQGGTDNGAWLAEIFRAIHTIKGTVGFLGFTRLERLAHAGEALLSLLRDGKCCVDAGMIDLLTQLMDRLRAVLELIETAGHEGKREVDDDQELIEALNGATRGRRVVASSRGTAPPERPGNAIETTVRVQVETLNRLMNLVGELVQTRNQFLQAEVCEESFARLGERLDKVTASLRESVMQARMQPVAQLFQRFPRLAREVATACGKSVRLEFSGGETGLDKSLLERLKDPLAHAVRNAIDHGIEPPQVRFPYGKPAEGKIQLRAFHEGGQIVVEVKDDGAGINVEKVVKRAVERGLISAESAPAIGNADAMELLFEPGFSTSDEITMISGRGVGLDVVRENVERMGGTVELESAPGEGTTLRLRVPLTLAIVPALIAHCGGQSFAVPHSTLLEMVVLYKHEEAERIQRIGNAKMFLLRERLIPLLDLSEMLGIGSHQENGFYIAILEAKGCHFGLIVDDMDEPQEIVVKPLSSVLSILGVYSGATILGDGTIALVLDTTGVARSARLCETRDRTATVEVPREHAASVSSHGIESRMIPLLLLVDHRGQRAVMPLACVERIERMEPGTVQTLAGEGVLQHRDELITLEDAGGLLQQARSMRESDPVVVLICSRPAMSDVCLGLIVRDVLDVVEGDVLPPSTSREGRVARVESGLVAFYPGFEPQTQIEDSQGAVQAKQECERNDDVLKEAA